MLSVGALVLDLAMPRHGIYMTGFHSFNCKLVWLYANMEFLGYRKEPFLNAECNLKRSPMRKLHITAHTQKCQTTALPQTHQLPNVPIFKLLFTQHAHCMHPYPCVDAIENFGHPSKCSSSQSRPTLTEQFWICSSSPSGHLS